MPGGTGAAGGKYPGVVPTIGDGAGETTGGAAGCGGGAGADDGAGGADTRTVSSSHGFADGSPPGGSGGAGSPDAGPAGPVGP